MTQKTSDDDDDLTDLLGGAASNNSSEMAPLNLDHSSQGELDVSTKARRSSCSLVTLCCAYSSYFCEYAPRFCLTLAVIALVIPSYFLIMGVFFNPTEHFGVINDYTNVNSQYDLTVGKIDHWCLRGDNDSCRCEDPLQPQSRGEFRSWSKAHGSNKEVVHALVEKAQNPDIAFVGSSVVEEMDGRWFGDARDDQLASLEKIFKKNFNRQEGGTLEGVALGIAGDTSPSILWRLMNGEMVSDFNPKIWWLELGLNDLGRAQCSEEVVVLGILRIVEEILNKKTDARIVINSLFPMADLRGGLKPKSDDYKDSFQQTHKRKPKQQHGDKRERVRGNQRQLRLEGETRRRTRWFGFPQQNSKAIKMAEHKETQKKYNAVTHKERHLPLWTSITAINGEIKKFCSKHDRVYFFDATEIFAERYDSESWILKTDMISMRGHPTKAGYERWEGAVVERAKTILRGTDE